jgi:hypothetical protein
LASHPGAANPGQDRADDLVAEGEQGGEVRAGCGETRARGARRVTVCGPVLDPRFRPAAGPAEQLAARARFGLPEQGRLALVVAGSRGSDSSCPRPDLGRRSGVVVVEG